MRKMTRSLASMAIVGAGLFAAGCSPTHVTFEGPQGSVIFVYDQPYNMPAQVEVWRPWGTKESNRYNISAVFTTPQGDLRAQGVMEVHAYNESEVDKMVVNNCRFDDEQLANLAKGVTLVYKLQSASRQPLADITLVRK